MIRNKNIFLRLIIFKSKQNKKNEVHVSIINNNVVLLSCKKLITDYNKCLKQKTNNKKR